MLTHAERINLKATIAAGLLAHDADSWLEDTRYLAVSADDILKQIIATEDGTLSREVLNAEEYAAEQAASSKGEPDGNDSTQF